MPVLAAAVGAGVGSIYRQVGAKEDVIAALVIERAHALVRRFTAALGEPDAWAALERATYETAHDGATDFLSQTAWDEAAAPPPRRRRGTRRPRPARSRRWSSAPRRARCATTPRTRTSGSCSCPRARRRIDPAGARRLAELVLRGMQRT